MTNLERLLEQSKKIRDAATPGPWFTEPCDSKFCWCLLVFCKKETDYPKHCVILEGSITAPNAEFVVNSRNTHEIKDQMIAVMFDALLDCRNLMRGSTKVAPLTDSLVFNRSQAAIDRVEQLAAQALGEK